MAWAPRQVNFQGMHGIFKALRTIITNDNQAALDWANVNLGLDLAPFNKIRWATAHSSVFPLLVAEPANGEPVQGERTLEQTHVFDITVFLQGPDPDQLSIDAVGYITALQCLLLGAKREDWLQFFTPGKAAFISIDTGAFSYEQLDSAEEESDLYVRGCGMPLTITVSEVMP